MESSNQLAPDQIAERLQMLQVLLQSPGWAYFTYAMQQSIHMMKEAGKRAETPHQMGFSFGGAMATEQVLTWPMREAGLLRETLQALQGMSK